MKIEEGAFSIIPFDATTQQIHHRIVVSDNNTQSSILVRTNHSCGPQNKLIRSDPNSAKSL